MPTVIRGSDNIDTSNVATQTELDAKNPQMTTAWCVFTGTTAVRVDAFNVTSVSKTTTGTYQVTFTENMDNTNYAVVFGNKYDNHADVSTYESKTVSGFVLKVFGMADNIRDGVEMSFSVFGGKN